MTIAGRLWVALVLFILAAIVAGLAASDLVTSVSTSKLIAVALCLGFAGLAVRS